MLQSQGLIVGGLPKRYCIRITQLLSTENVAYRRVSLLRCFGQNLAVRYRRETRSFSSRNIFERSGQISNFGIVAGPRAQRYGGCQDGIVGDKLGFYQQKMLLRQSLAAALFWAKSSPYGIVEKLIVVAVETFFKEADKYRTLVLLQDQGLSVMGAAKTVL